MDFLFFVSRIYHLLYNILLSFTFLFVLHNFLQHIHLYLGLHVCVYVSVLVYVWYLGKIVMGRVYLKYLAIKEDILNSYPKDTSFLSWDILPKKKNQQIFYITTLSMLHIICLSPSSPLHFFWLRGWDRNNRNDLVAWLFPDLLLRHSAVNLPLKSIFTSLKVNLITSTHLHFFPQFKAIWLFSPFHWKLFHWIIILIQNLVGSF